MSPPSLRQLSRSQRIALFAAVVVGTAVRIAYQHGRPFTGDEVGSLRCLAHDYEYLLTHFEPWLSMNVYLVVTKMLATVSHSNPWVMTAPSLLAGVAAIPLTAAVGVRVTSSRTAVVAAVLVAGNPFLVFYGVQLRSYMLLASACLAALLFFLDWSQSGRWLHGVACAGAMLLAVLMHANAIYFAGFLGVLFVHWLWDNAVSLRPRRPAATALLLPAIVAAAMAAFVFAPVLGAMREFSKDWTDVPPTSIAYVPYVAGIYFGRGFLMLPSLALLTWGAWTASQRNHRLALLGFGAIVPVTMASFAGLSHYPWGYARFFVFALPLLLLILAEGVTTAPGVRSPLLCGIVALFVLATWSPDLRRRFEEKSNRPWRAIATFLRTHMEPADLLVVSGEFTALNLSPYLGEQQRNFRQVASFLAPGKAAHDGQIFFIQPGEPIMTEAPSWWFGIVQIVTYTAPTRTAEAEALLTDLEQSLQGKISDTRVGDYRLVLNLLAALGRPDVGSKNTRRYYECLMRTRRQRWALRQLLQIPADEE